jgi:hypothetical protein
MVLFTGVRLQRTLGAGRHAARCHRGDARPSHDVVQLNPSDHAKNRGRLLQPVRGPDADEHCWPQRSRGIEASAGERTRDQGAGRAVLKPRWPRHTARSYTAPRRASGIAAPTRSPASPPDFCAPRPGALWQLRSAPPRARLRARRPHDRTRPSTRSPWPRPCR